jgi:hypothetical protein
MTGVSLGMTGVGDVAPGLHLCALYSGDQERDDVLFPFIEAGLRAGEKCLCLVDRIGVTSVLDRLLQRVDDEGMDRLQLTVDRASDVYLETGRFSSVEMTAFLDRSVDAVGQESNGLLRAVGEMSWVLSRPPGADEFFAYESAVNRVVAGRPALFLCLYDLERFDADMLVEVLRTHPRVLVGRTVLENPHYESPQTYRPGRLPAPRLERLEAQFEAASPVERTVQALQQRSELPEQTTD